MEDSRGLRHDRSWIAISLFVIMIIMMSFGFLEPVVASFLAAGLMIATRCISANDARRSLEWQVLLTVAAAFGLGAALTKSGAAASVASLLIESFQSLGPYAVLASLYFLTFLLTTTITNNAAAVLIYPFCLEAARLLSVSPRPFVMLAALAASASFTSPIGYQTNMMVFGPGGYKFTDFVRVGLPLNLLLWIAAIFLIPIAWPF